MTTDPYIVDISVDPDAARSARRRQLLVRAAPFLTILLVLAALIAVTVLNYRANRQEILVFADDLVATLEERVRGQVASVLRPADRAVALGAAMVERGAGEATFEEMAQAVLAAEALLSAVYVGRPDGGFLMVQRSDRGGLDTKRIERSTAGRRVTWVRRDAAQAVVSRAEDPDDTFDPRTRPWYQGAAAAPPGRAYWTDPYRFFTTGLPGITAARAVRGPDGSVAAVVGADIRIGTLSRFLQQLHVVRTGEAVLIGSSGRIVAAPQLLDPELVPEDENVLPSVEALGDPELIAAYDRLRVERATRAVTTLGDRRYLLAVSSLADLLGRDLWVMILVPESDFTGFLLRNGGAVLGASAVVIAIALGLASVLALQSRQIDRRLRMVEARDHRIAELAGVFDRMHGLLRDSRGDAHQAAARLAETLAATAGARRAHVWRLEGDEFHCLGCCDGRRDGHTVLPTFARDQAPALAAALERGEILVMTAEEIGSTVALADLSAGAAGARLTVAPVAGRSGLVGMVVLEAPGATLLSDPGVDLLLRYGAGVALPAMADEGALVAAATAATPRPAGSPPAALPGRAGRIDIGSVGIDLADRPDAGRWPGTAGEQPPGEGRVIRLTGLAVLEVVMGDDEALARTVAPGCPLMAAVAEAAREVASDHGARAARLTGDRMQLAAGLDGDEADAAAALLDAALALQARLRALYVAVGAAPAFAIGVDAAPGLACAVGAGSPGEPPTLAVWGRPLRVARRLARTAPTGTTQVGDRVADRLAGRFVFRRRGRFHLDRGAAVDTFLLIGRAA